MLNEKRDQKVKLINIAGRLPENSCNSFVDLQSQNKTVKKDRPKNYSFHKRMRCYFFNF